MVCSALGITMDRTELHARLRLLALPIARTLVLVLVAALLILGVLPAAIAAGAATGG